MFGLEKIFSSRNARYLNKMRAYLPKIQEIYQTLRDISDEELLAKSEALKDFYVKQINKETKEDRIAVEREKALKKMLPEAFALMKEALRREFHIELYDVQLIGGMVLHFGNIAEMKTGEGKTYTAVLPAYLNALTGHSVHIVTVNDYLADRDAQKVKPVFARLGLTVSSNVKPDLPHAEREVYMQEQYKANIVYGTSNNFGFDFLHDNLEVDASRRVMQDRFFAIVDEVDSVLIDEARTPLIISKQAELEQTDKALMVFARDLVKTLEVGNIIDDKNTQFEKAMHKLGNEEIGDFKLDLNRFKVIFTEQGMDKLAKAVVEAGILSKEEELYYSVENFRITKLIQTAAEAEYARIRNKDYIVQDDQIVIIDPMTGRLQPGRSWSDGLHQALEIKENVKLSPQTETSATITLQHYFRKYAKLSGMTGTADTEAGEFYQVYGLETFVIPTNKPVKRIDRLDRIFSYKKQRDALFLKLVKENHEKGRPILIGTNSVRENEAYSKLLIENNIPHEALNAKNHSREAEIIAKAGELGAITLATNMAGRGTDIILGGTKDKEIENIQQDIYHRPEYKIAKVAEIEAMLSEQKQQIMDLGGLLVISLGKNESRRVDNQLRGRAGRQGDVGESVFLVSLDDEIFLPFGDIIGKIKAQLGVDEINSPFLSRSVENLQKKMENMNFEGRKYIMEFSEAGDKQTDVIYDYRNSILDEENLEDFVLQAREMLTNEIRIILDGYIPLNSYEEFWNIGGLNAYLAQNDIEYNLTQELQDNPNLDTETIKDRIIEKFIALFEQIEEIYSSKENFGIDIKMIMLSTLDKLWVQHLTNLEEMRKGIGLRSYAQKNPKEEYKREAFEMFERLLYQVRADVVHAILELRNQIIPEIEAPIGIEVEDFDETVEAIEREMDLTTDIDSDSNQ